MEEDDYVVKSGIDTSELIVISRKININNLKEENSYLKCNLQENVTKLNEVLK
ncbi:14593_t:CDS:1, partial [Funneliformis geosporum]